MHCSWICTLGQNRLRICLISSTACCNRAASRTHTRTHARKRAHSRTQTQHSTHNAQHTHKYTHIYTHIHAYIKTRTHSPTRARTHMCVRTCAQTHTASFGGLWTTPSLWISLSRHVYLCWSLCFQRQIEVLV